MKQLTLFALLFGFSLSAVGQIVKESTKVDFIKSIYFSRADQLQQIPLIRRNESFTLYFDDLLAQDNDYYYRIKHFNHDWTPSDLIQNQYLEGFDNQRIENFNSSYGTLQTYNNYALTLPTNDTRFRISGNYMIEIYNSYDELMFARKFMIYEEKAQVQLGVYPTQKVERLLSHQNLQFTINPLFSIRNPQNDLKVVLLQNDQWNSSILAPVPQYNSGNSLVYRYEEATQFEGGNEYLNFDTKDLRSVTPNISYVNKGELYEHYLYTDAPRKEFPYTYYPDINGNFLIQTLQGSDPNIEADYTEVYFSLAKQYSLKEEEIYIYGKFNNYALTDENKMVYNPSLEIYEGILLLKQGFYNYKYLEVIDGNTLKNSISGSYSQTENLYTVLVYHRGIGDLYDSLIGIGQAQSFALER
ncbi:MAG: DUF5103 domain-containing protein [Flavobacteriaceae bacterium]|nr:DUF5103 domain-containing protein [Flavobacteriaceae bacterium]